MINLNPRSISKEIKRNRVSIDFAEVTKSNCDKLKRLLYVYFNCSNRYNKKCSFVKLKYDYKIDI